MEQIYKALVLNQIRFFKTASSWGLLLISPSLQIQGSVQGIVVWYSPWTMTLKLKMPERGENQEMNCMLIVEI
ncbi:MAG TPA: hypothetical protein DCF44_06470 [Chitinophagaceae bacterium]|nr:hypothetical protein [Chitinophagaceae bacterium]